MAQQPRNVVEMKDFYGLVTNVDPREIPEGSAEVQVNACSIRMAELVVRAGIREVTFENS